MSAKAVRPPNSGTSAFLPLLDIRAADLASRTTPRDDLNERPKLGGGKGGLNVRNWVSTVAHILKLAKSRSIRPAG